MAPPSALLVATRSLERLVKEEKSYHDELEKQEQRLQKLMTEINPDGNHEWNLKQERKAIEETRVIIPELRQFITEALQKLESQLNSEVSRGATNEEVERAKGIIQIAKTSLGTKE